MTTRAAKSMLAKLVKLSHEGHDPVELVDRSIRNSWQDVYPEKKQYNKKQFSKKKNRKLVL